MLLHIVKKILNLSKKSECLLLYFSMQKISNTAATDIAIPMPIPAKIYTVLDTPFDGGALVRLACRTTLLRTLLLAFVPSSPTTKYIKKRPFSSIVAGDHILLVLSYRREMDISYIEMRCNCHALCTICVILLVIWVVNVCDASLVVLKVFDMLVASRSDSVTFSVDVVSSSSTTKRYK